MKWVANWCSADCRVDCCSARREPINPERGGGTGWCSAKDAVRSSTPGADRDGRGDDLAAAGVTNCKPGWDRPLRLSARSSRRRQQLEPVPIRATVPATWCSTAWPDAAWNLGDPDDSRNLLVPVSEQGWYSPGRGATAATARCGCSPYRRRDNIWDTDLTPRSSRTVGTAGW